MTIYIDKQNLIHLIAAAEAIHLLDKEYDCLHLPEFESACNVYDLLFDIYKSSSYESSSFDNVIFSNLSVEEKYEILYENKN